MNRGWFFDGYYYFLVYTRLTDHTFNPNSIPLILLFVISLVGKKHFLRRFKIDLTFKLECISIILFGETIEIFMWMSWYFW